MKKASDPAVILQDLRKIPSNKRCFDCQQAGTTYTVVEFGIFLCSICGGLHREFNHRVKGLSTCNFTAQEVEKLQQLGNEKAAQLWMGRHDPRSHPIPDIKDNSRLRDFIRLKYSEKRWYDDGKAVDAASRSEIKPPMINQSQPPKTQQVHQPQVPLSAPAVKSLIDFDEEPKSTENWGGFQQSTSQTRPNIAPPGQLQQSNPQFSLFENQYQGNQATNPNNYGQVPILPQTQGQNRNNQAPNWPPQNNPQN